MANENSVIYRSIITSKFRTEKLLNFYNSVGDGANQITIYGTFGRSEPWSENEKEVGFAPPYPTDSTAGVVDMWTHMMGAVKINKSLLDAVIPRKDWGDTGQDNPRTFFINDIVVVNSAPYNRTDVGSGWMVYRVTDVPDRGYCSISSIDAKVECLKLGGKWTPTHESIAPPVGKGDSIDMGDGYRWEYLYTIPPDAAINRCTNEHIVVPFPDELRQDPARWGYDNVITWYNDYNLLYRLKVVTLRFQAYMDSAQFPTSALVGNTGFRQLSIILNPLEKKALPSDPDVKAVKDKYRPQDLEPHSGEMIYMENRQPIVRSLDQTELVSVLFEF
jgi:hypothetical protein